jgi:hypothetical protein
MPNEVHQSAVADPKPPIIIGGCPRSGTTLLRVMLDSHPNIACGPELKAIPNVAMLFAQVHKAHSGHLQRHHGISGPTLARIFGAQIKSLLEPYRLRRGKPRIAEKTPDNFEVFRLLAFMLPGSPLINVIRDGRDVVCSLLTQKWLRPSTGNPISFTRNARRAAELWVDSITRTRSLTTPKYRRIYHELRYEDLVNAPEPTLKALFAFLEEPWDPVVLGFDRIDHDPTNSAEEWRKVMRPVDRSAIGRWRRDLSPADKEIVKEVAGRTLIDLDYCRDLDW